MTTKAVTTRLDELLEPLGFVRRKATWNREREGFVDVVDVQVSKAGDAITVNAGVLDPDVFAKCWGTSPPAFVEEPSCTVRARVGALIDGRDRWWPATGEQTAQQVAENVKEFVLPFLENTRTREAMEGFLTDERVVDRRYPLPIIYLALLKARAWR